MAVIWVLLWGSFTSMRPSSNSSLSSGRKKPRSTSCSYSHRLQRRMRIERACIIRVRVGRYRRLRQRRRADTPRGTAGGASSRGQELADLRQQRQRAEGLGDVGVGSGGERVGLVAALKSGQEVGHPDVSRRNGERANDLPGAEYLDRIITPATG